MHLANSLAILCLVVASSAHGSDLVAIDRAGRAIAERPCEKPRVTTRDQRSPHDNTATDRYFSIRCANAGSELVAGSDTGFNRKLPLFASIKHADRRVPEGYRVGDSLSLVRERLGAPEVEKPDSITYLLPGESRDERVTFLHDQKTIKRIQWSWYFD